MKKVRVWIWLVILVLSAGALSLAPAQDKKDKKDKEAEKIEKVVAAVVEAYQQGDYDSMGKYYAADCTVVSGGYNRVIVGWENVSRLYRAQHARLTSLVLLRENTTIRRKNKVAWVSYQWQLAMRIEEEQYAFQGHTTLVMEKRGRNWIIVHNHTSALASPDAVPPAS